MMNRFVHSFQFDNSVGFVISRFGRCFIKRRISPRILLDSSLEHHTTETLNWQNEGCRRS